MSRLIPMLLTGLVVLAPVSSWPAESGQGGVAADRAAALKTLHDRIGEYAALHRRLGGPLPPLKASTSQRSTTLNRTFLASAIKAARPHARQGDIFTAAVGTLFRDLAMTALKGRDIDAFLDEPSQEHDGVAVYHPKVYDHYPDWASHRMPMVLLQSLPTLPEDIEYRLIGRDLILWDSHADLIIDVLVDAVPAQGRVDD